MVKGRSVVVEVVLDVVVDVVSVVVSTSDELKGVVNVTSSVVRSLALSSKLANVTPLES